MGMKSPDLLIAWGCSACHDIVDGRRQTEHTHESVLLMHAEGVFRTQVILSQAEVIRYGRPLR